MRCSEHPEHCWSGNDQAVGGSGPRNMGLRFMERDISGPCMSGAKVAKCCNLEGKRQDISCRIPPVIMARGD